MVVNSFFYFFLLQWANNKVNIFLSNIRPEKAKKARIDQRDENYVIETLGDANVKKISEEIEEITKATCIAKPTGIGYEVDKIMGTGVVKFRYRFS